MYLANSFQSLSNGVRTIVTSKSKTFLAFCFCFLAGIALGSLVNRRIEFIYFYTNLFILAGFLIIFWKNRAARFILFSFLISLFAFIRYNFALPPTDFKLPTGEQTFTAFVAAEPDVRQDSVRYIVKAISNKKVYLQSSLYPRYQYGDVLEITCRLERPEPFDGFRYDMYLARLGVFAICRDPALTKVGAGGGSVILSKILSFKDRVSKRVNTLWHEPYAGFVAGVIYGDRAGLGRLTEDFNRTGVAHILAISGYNISLIAKYLLIVCTYLWIPRKKAFYLVAALIAAFVLFVGAGGSVVRAGVMGFLVLLAGQLGRLNRVGNALALTAVLMSLYNPFVLVWDAGFQLSFLATVGIIYLPPLFASRIQKIPLPEGLKEIIVSTLAAIVATLPLILYQFGRLSLVAPLVNVLILWIIPWVMLGGFVSLVLSFVFFPIGQALAWLTLIPMKYVTAIVSWFSSLPWSAVDFHLPWWAMLALYAGLCWWVRAAHARC